MLQQNETFWSTVMKAMALWSFFGITKEKHQQWPWLIPHPDGRIGPYSDIILVCGQEWLSFFPDNSSSSPTVSWLRLSSLFLVGLVLPCNQELTSITLVMVDADDPCAVHVQSSKVFVLWECSECCQWDVAQFYLLSPHLLDVSPRDA